MKRSWLRKSIATLILFSAGLAILFAQRSHARAQMPKLPLAEMERLSKLYVGTWTYTETYPKSPMSPEGGVNTGTYTSELGPGGNSILNRFHSKGPVGDFEGVIVMTWDPKAGEYKAYVLTSSFPGALVETGKLENDTFTLRTEFSMGSMNIAMRNVTKFQDGGKLTSDQYSSANGSPEALIVHVEATKK